MPSIGKEFLLVLNQQQWEASTQVIQNFVGNHRAENYVELVDNTMKIYQLMSARMTLKTHLPQVFFHQILKMLAGRTGLM